MVVAHAEALLHRALEDDVAGFARFVDDGLGEGGLATLFGENDGADGFSGIPGLIEFFSANDAVRRRDLAEDATHAHFFTGRTAPHITERTADTEIDFADRERPSGRAGQPALEQLGLGEGVEDEATGSVEDAG